MSDLIEVLSISLHWSVCMSVNHIWYIYLDINQEVFTIYSFHLPDLTMI